MMKGKHISALWEFHHDGVFEAVRAVILSELGAQAPRLYTDHGIKLRIEIGRAAEDFRSDLELFDGSARMIHGVLRQITEQFAKGLRAMQGLTVDKPINLLEEMLPFGHRIP